MVRKLRIRFTAASSLILLAVLSVIGVAINVMNYYNFIASTRETMSVIAANNGEFPDYEDYLQMLEEERAREELERNKGKDASFDEPDDEPEAETTAETSILEKFEYTAGFGFGLNVTAETAYETRYFYVRFTPDGGMLGYDLSHIAEVSMEEAESLGRNVLSQKSESGVYGNYRYYMHDTEGGAREIIFLNCATQLRSVNFVLFISIFTIIAVLATVTLSLWMLSRRIVKPFVENLDKQKKFITDAGHEIKTPLSIIDANAEVLKLTAGENEWIDSIQNQTSRLAALVKKLIALSKNEEELSELPHERFNVSEAAAETVSPFLILAEKNGVTLNSRIEEGIEYVGNEASIRQLFGILLDNAVKYTPGGGTINIALERRAKITLEISNDCDPVDTEKLPLYFDRFFRADDSRSRETGGYGIGLSIAKAIVERHRGKITVSSEDGTSLKFTVTL